MQCLILYVMGWMQKLTKFVVTKYIVVAAKECWDLFEDETLFGCLFGTNTTNSDSLQNDHLNSTYISCVCYNTSSQSDGPDQSTSLSSETVEC